MLKLLSLSLLFILGCDVRYQLTKEGIVSSNSTQSDSTKENNKENCQSFKTQLFVTQPQAFSSLSLSENKQEVESFSGEKTTSENFNYYSYSSHPIVGPKPRTKELIFFLYEGSDGVSLNFIVNKDDTTVVNQELELTLEVKDNENKDGILIVDDSPSDFDKNSVTAIGTLNKYQFYFLYSYNSDGAAIGPLWSENFSIEINPIKFAGIKKASFITKSGDEYKIDLTQPLQLYKEKVCLD